MTRIASGRNPGGVNFQEAAITMATAVLIERIQSLPSEDKEDLFRLLPLLGNTANVEESQAAVAAFAEILEQRRGKVESFMVEDEPITLDSWIEFVSKRIHTAREDAGLTQGELEDKTGLPQSHISRLENGVHSPSSSTLEKIANATGKPLSFFDPNHSNVSDGDDD